MPAAVGLFAEATTPGGMRWLLKGMEVSYLAKSSSDLICTAKTTDADWAGAPDVPVRVEATRSDETVVIEGIIHLWGTPKDDGAKNRFR